MFLSVGLTAFVSILAAFLFWKIKSLASRIALVTLASFGTSYALYWLPVLLGAKDDQYSTWAPMVIGICFVAGLIGGGMGLLIVAWLKTKAN